MLDSFTERNASLVNMTSNAGGLSKSSNLTVPSTELAIARSDRSIANLSSSPSGLKKNDPMAWWITHMEEFERTRRRNPAIETHSLSFPDFIRPLVNPTEDCNLWGPLCQTGTIEVELNLTTKITTTTVPCSYYLSAQAKSAVRPGYIWANPDYQTSFGHSRECSAYAQVFKAAGKPDEEKVRSSVFAFSNCGSNIFDHSQRPEQYTPPGVSNYNVGGGAKDFFYCGDCSLDIKEIRLLYFPDATSVDCSQRFANSTSKRLIQLKNSFKKGCIIYDKWIDFCQR